LQSNLILYLDNQERENSGEGGEGGGKIFRGEGLKKVKLPTKAGGEKGRGLIGPWSPTGWGRKRGFPQKGGRVKKKKNKTCELRGR